MRLSTRFWRETLAATSAEYALILALLGGGIALASIALGKSIACSIDYSATIIEDGSAKKLPNYGNSDPNGQANGHKKRC